MDDFALGGREVATDEIKQGRLARAIWPDNAMPFSRLYFKVHVIHGYESTKLFCEALKDQARGIHPFPP
jgi:hypothetical protein